MNLLVTGIIGILALAGAFFAVENHENLGATSFPTSLDTLTNPTATDRTNVVSHADQHSNANDSIEALQAKIGADGSAVTTSHTYKLSGVATGDKSVSLTGTEVLTNKTLTAPTLASPTLTNSTLSTTTSATTTLTGSTTVTGAFALNLGSDATGDVFYRASTGKVSRLGVGSNGDFLTLSSGIPAWTPVSAVNPSPAVNATSTASTTIGITVDGTDFIQVFAYGSVLCTNGAQSCNPVLKFGGQTVDLFESQRESANQYIEFFLTWFATPSATTTTLSLESGGNVSSFYDATIIYYKY